MPLTDAKIRSAKPQDKTFKLYDTGGLHLEVSPAGGRWWRLKYRFGGKAKRISLGVYPDVSLRDARERRDTGRKLLAQGVDPSANRKAEKSAQADRAANSFEIIAREWFAKASSNWVPAHAARKLSLFERDVFPQIGNRPVAEITASELLNVLREIEKRDVVETEHRALVSCSQVFRFAVASGRMQSDPSRDLRDALPTRKAEHFAAVTKPEELTAILRAFEGYDGTLPVRCALRLMPLLFVRPGELRKAEWAEFDLDAARWDIPAERMKMRQPHVVPLSRQVVATLRELNPLTGNGKYVFPSARSGKRPMSDNAILAAMRRMEIPAEVTTGHGFRATARTILDEVLCVRADLIEHQLAHRVKDPNGRAYNRTAFLPERTAMMQAWADYLDQLKCGKVLPFRSVA